jgi:hypothetical protein
MPSDLPLMSTAWAMYPVPPQRGQFFGSTPPPQLLRSFSPNRARSVRNFILLRNTNKFESAARGEKQTSRRELGVSPKGNTGRFAAMVLLRQLSDEDSERLKRNLASRSG